MNFYESQKAKVEAAIRASYAQSELTKALEPDLAKGKKANIGEIREWKGGKYRKETSGWVPVKETGKKDLSEDKEVQFNFSNKKEEIKKLLKEIFPNFSHYEKDDETRILLLDSKYSPNYIEVAPANRYYGYEGAEKELYVDCYSEKEISSTSLADHKANYQTTSTRSVKKKKTKIQKTASSMKELENILKSFSKKIS